MNTFSGTRFFIRAQRFLLVAILGFLLSLSAQARQQAAAGSTASSAHPKIQLAILLDTSSSMDGLIDQARNQLWQVVNEFSQTTRNGVSPTLEVAVYEYGNDTLSAQNGYVRQVSNLTGELDQVSEALFSLTTNGGSEYCGYVIDNAVRNLQWSRSDNDIKVIFIAGNEPFTQGPVPYGDAIGHARTKGITVNTIHAGSYDEGAGSGWKEGALLAGGNYMSIDHNYQIAHVVAPQDQRIAELNQQLNNTYIPYGAAGAAKAERQAEQDNLSAGVSIGLLASRVQSKVSSLYNNANWDLVDALESGDVELDAIEDEALPAPMREMSLSDRKNYVEKNAEQRNKIQEEIIKLSKERENYVAEQKAKSAEPDVATIDKAFVSAIKQIGKQKGFDLKSK
jgi:hypothetical protein